MNQSVWTLGDAHPIVVRLATYIAVVLAQTPQRSISIHFDFIRRVVFVQGDAMCILTLRLSQLDPSITFGYWTEEAAPEPWITGPSDKIVRNIVEHLMRS